MRGVLPWFVVLVSAMGGAVGGVDVAPWQSAIICQQSAESHRSRAVASSSGRLDVGPTTRPAAALPEISYEDLVLLVKTARRAFQEKLAHLPERGARYRPPALRGLTAVIHLTLRSDGAALAEAESREMDVVDAAVAAGALLGQRVLEKKLTVPDAGELGIEFELLGPPEYLDAKYGEGGTWSDELLHSFEPAVEGIGVAFRGKRAWTRPSEVVSRNYTPDVALQAAESAVGLKHVHKVRVARDIRYFRFSAYHLWQRRAHVLPVVLVRGVVPVPAEPLGPEVLDAAIQRMGAYLQYRQNSDGWFSHVYLPSPDQYGQGNSAVVQMHALYGLAAYGAWSGKADVIADVEKGLEKTALFLRPLTIGKPVREGGPADEGPPAETPKSQNAKKSKSQTEMAETGLVLWFPGHGDHLGVSARLLLAISDHLSAISRIALLKSSATQPFGLPDPQSAIRNRQSAGLVEGILASQGADGGLEMAFRQGEGDERKGAAAGWALLALARSDPSRSDKRIERALHLALRYYRGREDLLADPTAAAALARAFALGYAWTNDACASTFVFETLDKFAGLQVTEAVCPWPEVYGAINVREPGAVGVDTATYLTVLADGLALAERIGDKQRANRYRQAVLAAARFVLQLEVREAGCYYIRSPRDALGGVRGAPWDNRIRVDHCAEALMSLMRAREVLYGAPKKR